MQDCGRIVGGPWNDLGRMTPSVDRTIRRCCVLDECEQRRKLETM